MTREIHKTSKCVRGAFIKQRPGRTRGLGSEGGFPSIKMDPGRKDCFGQREITKIVRPFFCATGVNLSNTEATFVLSTKSFDNHLNPVMLVFIE